MRLIEIQHKVSAKQLLQPLFKKRNAKVAVSARC